MDQPFAAMVKAKALTAEAAAYLQGCVLQRVNLLITGPNRHGRTALQKGIVPLIPPGEKVATLGSGDLTPLRQGERITSDDVRGMMASPVPSSSEEIRLMLGLKPDRLVLPEALTDEILDFFLAMDAGCAGSVTYLLSANSDAALTRLKFMLEEALKRRPDAPARARDANALIRRNVQVLVNVEGAKTTMRVTRIAEFTAGILGTSLTEVFAWGDDGLTRTRQRSRLIRET